VSGNQGNRGRLYIIRQDEAPHAGHHGGSWKVAYADFVTALMALFLLLWLLMALKPQQKEALAVFFQDPSGGEVAKGAPVPTSGPTSEVVRTTKERQVLRTISGQLKELVSKNPELGKQSGISMDSNGTSIRISSQMLFQQGTAQSTQEMLKVLQEVANVLKNQDVTMEVRGHTDDTEPVQAPYKSRWELSAARAAAVINVLVNHFGIAPERLTAIGSADTQPLVPNDTDANRAKNRRVEFLFSPTKEK